MRIRIYPYKLGSQSAKRLADALGALKVRPDGRYRYQRGDKIINWGNSRIPSWLTERARDNILNQPEAVAIASNKLETFNTLKEAGVSIVPFTTDCEEAKQWPVVYVRNTLTGHSGAGIEVVSVKSTEEERGMIERMLALGYEALAQGLSRAIENIDTVLPVAPLYTKGINNHGEYRVHVFKGEIIDYRKKCRRNGDEASEGDNKVRTLATGWIYRGDGLRRLERVENLAIEAIDALGLDFGAVDIILDEERNAKVLEINTACGMEDTTLQNYVNYIEHYYESQ